MGVPANLLHQFVPEGRNFAALSKTERARLRTILRPLPWLDGFITALAAVPEEPAGWTAYIWADDALESVTEDQASKVDTVVLDHSIAVAKTLFTDPESYQPFLADGPDRDQGAAQWAAGFRFGIELHPEPWRPLIEDDAARTLLTAIFCLERTEDMLEEDRSEFPFHDLPPARLEEMRQSAATILPAVVRGILGLILRCHQTEPYVRPTPKVGRNDPCPCGSGQKYKKCCLTADISA
jgi:uncharacterized protein